MLCSCNNTSLTNTLLKSANDYMSIKPDSALIVLEKLNRSDIKGRYNKAKYALLYSQALDKNYIDIKSDSIISQALKYYNRRGSSIEKAYTYYYSGRIYENKNNVDSAIIQYVHTEEYLSQTEDYYLQGLTANALARLYQSQNFIELSQNKYLDAANHFLRIDRKTNELSSYIGALRMMAIQENYELFESYYLKAYDLAVNLKDTLHLLQLTKLRAASIIDKDGDYRQAINLLLSATSNYCNNIVPNDYSSILSNSYLRLNQLDSASVHLQPLIFNSTHYF